jgi:hypothetical protein
MSELKSLQKPQEKPARPSDRRVRVKRETAPKAPKADVRKEPVVPPKAGARKSEPVAQSADQEKSASYDPLPEAPVPQEKPEVRVAPGSSSSELLKPRKPNFRQPGREQLFPGAGKMAKLEEGYRRSDGTPLRVFWRPVSDHSEVSGVPWEQPPEQAIDTFGRELRGEALNTALAEGSVIYALDMAR